MQSNVIGEIKGSVYPEKIIVVGGHLDSWDVGEGAHDDGTGIVQSMEVLRIMKATGYKPACTIRAVLYINEEFGNDGGETYAKVAKEKGWEHVAAIESDGGGSPRKALVAMRKMVKWNGRNRSCRFSSRTTCIPSKEDGVE
jgi:Zn-dependent M28 family amino/carboxypeptidase